MHRQSHYHTHNKGLHSFSGTFATTSINKKYPSWGCKQRWTTFLSSYQPENSSSCFITKKKITFHIMIILIIMLFVSPTQSRWFNIHLHTLNASLSQMKYGNGKPESVQSKYLLDYTSEPACHHFIERNTNYKGNFIHMFTDIKQSKASFKILWIVSGWIAVLYNLFPDWHQGNHKNVRAFLPSAEDEATQSVDFYVAEKSPVSITSSCEVRGRIKKKRSLILVFFR